LNLKGIDSGGGKRVHDGEKEGTMKRDIERDCAKGVKVEKENREKGKTARWGSPEGRGP